MVETTERFGASHRDGQAHSEGVHFFPGDLLQLEVSLLGRGACEHALRDGLFTLASGIGCSQANNDQPCGETVSSFSLNM